jgi:hypothetical protein
MSKESVWTGWSLCFCLDRVGSGFSGGRSMCLELSR